MATPYSRSSQDPQPWKCDIKISRKLVVCIDGTSNKFSQKNTNIVELYNHIEKSNKQLTYYSSGLGTVAKVSGLSLRNKISNHLDMAIGRNVDKVIMASYRWLSNTYQDEDGVFLFGFSRGAYQVRALAGMIARVGLLLPGNDEQIPFAFELYSQTKDDKGKQSDEKDDTPLAEIFKETFCRCNVHIHFIGVWDTVSSVGFGRKSILPNTTTSCGDHHFCYFRHALALDERRVKFLPEYIYGGQSSDASDGRINEVWFAGCHGDVGGGNRHNPKLQLGEIPFLWMRNQAAAAGLEMKSADVMWKIDHLNKRITNSMRLCWLPMELWFFKRLVYSDSNTCTHRPHLGDGRTIVKGQKVHVSVLFKHNYKPSALFHDPDLLWPDPMFWNHESSHQRLQNLSDVWEKDIFDHHSVQNLIGQLNKGQLNKGQSIREVLGRLAFMSTSDICKEKIRTCQDAKKILAEFLNNDNKVIQLSTAVMYCELDWSWPTDADEEQITKSVSELLNGDECRSACTYLPSLCRKIPKLINDENLKQLVELCVGPRNKPEEKTTTVLMKRASTFQKSLGELCNGKRTEKSEETSMTFFESAHALFIFMEVDDKVAQKLVDMEVVPNITKMLHYKDDSALVALLRVVGKLATHLFSTERSRDLITTVPIIHKLLQHYDDFVTPAAIRVLCSFLPDDTLRARILESKVLPSLFRVLRQRRSGNTMQAVRDALVGFMKHENSRDKMLECDVFQNLHDVLSQRSQADQTVQVVCNTLVEFVNHPDFRDKVLTHKVFTTLLDFKQWTSEQSMKAVCDVLVQFAEHENFRDKMLERDRLSTLCGVLGRRSDVTTQAVVCTTLGELLEYEKIREKMLECDLLPVLYDALQQLSGKTADVVSDTLIKLVKHDSLRTKVLSNRVFSTLCQVLRQWNSDEHKQGLCNTLVEFVKYDNLRDKMLECDVFPTLYDILRAKYCQSNETKQAVCNTLVELVKNDTLRAGMLECEVFPALFDMLHQQYSDKTVQMMTCNALVEFMKYEDKMLECDVFPSLGDMFQRRVVEIRQEVWKKRYNEKVCQMLVMHMTLTELVNPDNLQDKMSGCIVLSTLGDVLRYSAETMEAVYNTLVEIMKYENLDRMFTCKVLHIFCYALGQCESGKKKVVCNKFVEFMKYDTGKRKKLECMVLPTLCYVVSQHSDETKQMVCKTVVELGKHDVVPKESRQANNLCIFLSEVCDGNLTGSELSGADEDMHEAHSPPLQRVKSQ